MGILRAFHPSGGLFYHYLALKYRKDLWESFRKNVSDFLDHWSVNGHRLVIIGASGGYSLSPEFLARFRTILCVDPDPVAKWIFLRRFKDLKDRIEWDSKMVFDFPDLDHFEKFVLKEHGSDFLFSNILGQFGVVENHSDEQLNKGFERLQLMLSGANWASYHDRLSGRVEPQTLKPTHFDSPVMIEELGDHFYKRGGKDGFLIDHRTSALSLEHGADYCVWELYPNNYHVIEMIRNDS